MEYKVESISYSASSYTFVTDYSPNLCEDAILVFVNFKDNNIPDNILDYVASPAGTLKKGPLPGTVLQAFGNYRYKGTLKVYSKEDPTIKDECNLRKLFRDPEDGYDFVCYVTVKPGTRFVLHTSGMYARTAEEQSMSFHTDSSLITLDDVVFTMDTNQRTTYTAVFTAGNTPGTAIVTNTSDFPKIDKRKWVVKVGNDNDYVPVKKIEFSPRSVDELFKGETTVVEAIVSPSNATYKDIDWSVSMSGKIITERLSPTSVRIKAFGAGYSRLIAENCDDSATAWLPVFSQEKSTANDRIRISQKTLYLAFGESHTLTAEVTHDGVTRPAKDGEVGFWSTNSAVAKVGQGGTIRGVVTGISAGTAVIEAWIADHPSKKDTCTVYVDGGGGEQPEPEVTVSAVSLFKNELSLKVGSTYNLVAFIHRGDTKTTASVSDIAWSSSDSSVASISYGKITAKSEGVATITATSTEDRTKSATCVVTVTASSGSDDDPEPQPTPQDGTDVILRIDYEDGEFKAPVTLFAGDLGFDEKHPIESVVYYETKEIQKIYWVDGKNVLRFMNFMADEETIAKWNDGDNTHFDSNRSVEYGVTSTITKDNSGNQRANGVVQYLLTYYDRYGEETGIVWVSDLVYLSPAASGGAADGYNTNKITIQLGYLDKRFTNFRLYSLFRSTLDGTTVAYIVASGNTKDGEATVVDDGAHLTVEDASRLLFLGSQTVIAGTMTHKDQTLFLGNLESTGQDYEFLEKKIRRLMVGENGESKAITFEYSGVNNDEFSVPFSDEGGSYSYKNQLNYSSSQILTFKGGEKYRFALTFKTKSGATTRAFWIGDKENELYPLMDRNDKVVRRVVAKCSIDPLILQMASDAGLASVQVMIAEATYADRSVKAQGIVTPTMFNTWERYNSRLYAQPSWVFRPRNSWMAFSHFQPVENSTSSSGEIQCNYWLPYTTEYGTIDTDYKPKPYYILDANGDIMDKFDGMEDYTNILVMYSMNRNYGKHYGCAVFVVKATLSDGVSDSVLNDLDFTEIVAEDKLEGSWYSGATYSTEGISLVIYFAGFGGGGRKENSIKDAYNKLVDYLDATVNLWDTNYIPEYEGFKAVCESLDKDETKYYDSSSLSSPVSGTWPGVLNSGTWNSVSASVVNSDEKYTASFYKKHLMFVDENVVTLNSPELEYNAVSFDNASGHKFRIVGVARISNSYSDYTVDATHGKYAGESLVTVPFEAAAKSGNLDGLLSWPLWNERPLFPADPEKEMPDEPTSDDYKYGTGAVSYWLHMWNKSGVIDGYTNKDNPEYSTLNKKTFATMRFSDYTMYTTNSIDYDGISLRVYNQPTSQLAGISVGGEMKYYDGNPDLSLSMPGTASYPILFSERSTTPEVPITTEQSFLSSKVPVELQYASTPHAVIALHTDADATTVGGEPIYQQDILPCVYHGSHYFSGIVTIPEHGTGENSGALVPWEDLSILGADYPYKDYRVHQPVIFSDAFDERTMSIGAMDRYVFIGEVYVDYSAEGVVDSRYGGTKDSDIAANRFIAAGPIYPLAGGSNVIYANQGDTYFQRWDCMKTKPASIDTLNNVIDIASVMLETHINVDGRTITDRGTKYIASIDYNQFGQLNRVYSQQNNSTVLHDLDDELTGDSYNASITWSLPKADSADIDAWTHVTLATHLKLDGDKGECRALRRFGNAIIAFQDRGISEILFNSRTQLSTQEGVPVEIANSGKVDGKRYITNKYGCLNKWSITEGKRGLYFVDNINKTFCTFNGEGIQTLSSKFGFDVWFRKVNSITPWSPANPDNFVSFYDRIHSDVYLIHNAEDGEFPCLVYNENLDVFTSFFDYSDVPMMTNVEDKFVSFHGSSLWLQNEGAYCKFFGVQYPFSAQYRVTPNPYSDKIWTNVEYRADFYRVLNGEDAVKSLEYDFGDDTNMYQPNESFNYMRFWNEYQTTALEGDGCFCPEKRFRIWRFAIPRATKSEKNPYGLDRIRNPWLNLLFKKNYTGGDDETNQDMMQLHDMTVIYYE